MDKDDQYADSEVEQRLRKTLHAAFHMKPTPLKDIPKKHGNVRTLRSRISNKTKDKMPR